MTDKIRIRPSGVDNFFGCSWQWFLVHIQGNKGIPNARAACGTAIHKAAEVMWKEAMQTKVIDDNVSKLTDAAMETLNEEAKQDLMFDRDEDINTLGRNVISGVSAFIEDIVPFTEIPEHVERTLSITITGHPIINEVAGSLDYLGHGIVADLKTSRRKPTPSNYQTQQSIYRLLADENNEKIELNQIQAVIFNKDGTAAGSILQLEPNVEKAKIMVNTILDTTEVYAKDIVPPEVLFKGNPKHYLCSPKYCAFFPCKFVSNEAKEIKKKEMKLIEDIKHVD